MWDSALYLLWGLTDAQRMLQSDFIVCNGTDHKHNDAHIESTSESSCVFAIFLLLQCTNNNALVIFRYAVLCCHVGKIPECFVSLQSFYTFQRKRPHMSWQCGFMRVVFGFRFWFWVLHWHNLWTKSNHRFFFKWMHFCLMVLTSVFAYIFSTARWYFIGEKRFLLLFLGAGDDAWLWLGFPLFFATRTASQPINFCF